MAMVIFPFVLSLIDPSMTGAPPVKAATAQSDISLVSCVEEPVITNTKTVLTELTVGIVRDRAWFLSARDVAIISFSHRYPDPSAMVIALIVLSTHVPHTHVKVT